MVIVVVGEDISILNGLVEVVEDVVDYKNCFGGIFWVSYVCYGFVSILLDFESDLFF